MMEEFHSINEKYCKTGDKLKIDDYSIKDKYCNKNDKDYTMDDCEEKKQEQHAGPVSSPA
jgi:hypothetical protein